MPANKKKRKGGNQKQMLLTFTCKKKLSNNNMNKYNFSKCARNTNLIGRRCIATVRLLKQIF